MADPKCINGSTTPDGPTRNRLFADSGGFCANPECRLTLFDEADGKNVTLGDCAHIVAASEGGARGREGSPGIDRNSYENLVMLCVTCHRRVDGLPEEYPVDLLLHWKAEHRERTEAAHGAATYDDRATARSAVAPLLDQNRAIHEALSPDSPVGADLDGSGVPAWRRKMLMTIIPNNRTLLRIGEMNGHLLTETERAELAAFREHVDDLERLHIDGVVEPTRRQFPGGFTSIFEVGVDE